MKPIPAEEFLSWAAQRGIHADEAKLFRMLPNRDHARFWVFPPDPAMLPYFVATLLDGLDEWATAFLWPRSGSWPEYGKSQSKNEAVRDVVLRGLGVPSGFSGAMQFDRKEEDALITLLFVYLIFAWCVDDDLVLVPDHGRQLLQTDHHDVIHAECLSEVRIQQLIAHMASEGYDLPTELPDDTFRRPIWME